MERCNTCRNLKYDDETNVEICTNIKVALTINGISKCSDIYTPKEFGCIHHEPRPKTKITHKKVYPVAKFVGGIFKGYYFILSDGEMTEYNKIIIAGEHDTEHETPPNNQA